MAKKRYFMKGTLPIIVNRYGRVNPGDKSFVCDMDPEQEDFFQKIGAILIDKEVPDDTPITPASMPRDPSSAFWPSEVRELEKREDGGPEFLRPKAK